MNKFTKEDLEMVRKNTCRVCKMYDYPFTDDFVHDVIARWLPFFNTMSCDRRGWASYIASVAKNLIWYRRRNKRNQQVFVEYDTYATQIHEHNTQMEHCPFEHKEKMKLIDEIKSHLSDKDVKNFEAPNVRGMERIRTARAVYKVMTKLGLEKYKNIFYHSDVPTIMPSYLKKFKRLELLSLKSEVNK